MSITSDELTAIREWARSHADIAEVWLYGSVARGDTHAGSDIDLALVMVGSDPNRRFARFPDHPETWVAEMQLSRRVHLEWYDPEAKASMRIVSAGVQRDGVLLYQKGQGEAGA